ncbi:MAG: hypothetical protein JO360_02790 [Acidobacteria bacterium]|nr:hypothetical protein [Acidobacteriota bacterium]
MKSKLSILLAMSALILGLSVTGSAQVVKRRLPNGRIVYETTQRRDTRRYDRRYDNRRYDRRDDRWDNQDWRRQNERRRYGARTYRLPNGRLVTILPNGRRIYR